MKSNKPKMPIREKIGIGFGIFSSAIGLAQHLSPYELERPLEISEPHKQENQDCEKILVNVSDDSEKEKRRKELQESFDQNREDAEAFHVAKEQEKEKSDTEKSTEDSTISKDIFEINEKLNDDEEGNDDEEDEDVYGRY